MRGYIYTFGGCGGIPGAVSNHIAPTNSKKKGRELNVHSQQKTENRMFYLRGKIKAHRRETTNRVGMNHHGVIHAAMKIMSNAKIIKPNMMHLQTFVLICSLAWV